MLEVASAALLLAGAAFGIAGGIGLLRLPDFYCRIHSAGINDTLGAGLILAGLLLRSPDWIAGAKLVAILAFLLITSPTSTHALANAALETGLRPRLDEADDSSPAR